MNPLIAPNFLTTWLADSKVQQKMQDIKSQASTTVKNIKGTAQSLPRRAQNVLQKWHNQMFNSGKGTLAGIAAVNGPGTDIVLLDKDALRVTPDTEQRGTLFNEFVEKYEPTIHTAEWYKDNQHATVSDRYIPVTNFHVFGGLEDGAFKVQPLQAFNDTTTIIPSRNITSGIFPIQEILAEKQDVSQEDVERSKEIDREIRSLGKYTMAPQRSNGKWYQASSSVTGGNPFLVPKTGQVLTDEDMYNIGRRLRVYDLTKQLWDSPNFRNSTDSAVNYFYMYDKDGNWPNDVYGDYLDRQEGYIINAKRAMDNMTDNIDDWTKKLSPEEEQIYKLWFDGSAEGTYAPITYGGAFGFNQTHTHIPQTVRTALDWWDTQKHSAKGIPEHDKKFLAAYDPKFLKDVEKLQAVKKYIEQLKKEKVDLLLSTDPISVVTTNNDTIPISQYNASVLDKKTVLGNPNGSMFIADFGNMSYDQLKNIVNPYLKKNPSYLFMPDMGAYSLYGLQNGIDPDMRKHTYMDITQKPSYTNYWNQFTEKESKEPYDPAVHYLIGVKKQGGKINYLNIF